MRPEPLTKSDREDICNELLLGAVLGRFDGDATAALDAASHDISFMQHVSIFESLTMSYGYARGWKHKVLA